LASLIKTNKDYQIKITTARTVKDNLNLDFSVRTIQLVIAANPIYKKENIEVEADA